MSSEVTSHFTQQTKLLAEMRSGGSLDWDIIIIGGGITGAGVLREAVRRGYEHCCLSREISPPALRVAHRKWFTVVCAIWLPVTLS